MDWEKFYDSMKAKGGSSVKSIHSLSLQIMRMMTILDGFPSLSMTEIFAIGGAFGSNFQIQGQEYNCVEYHNGIYVYQSGERTIAYGETSRFIMIVCGEANAKGPCLEAADFGLSILNALPYYTV
ncbi:unnamed protein product [Clavelina lepadiformis]|uniref:Profilin n=1 Tax=Clavelina lepadiformis TaxID=159417 RepID=A0ABP0GUI2_CLALP